MDERRRDMDSVGACPGELSYTVQSLLIRQCISEPTWNLFTVDARRYLLNVSLHMDDFFLYQTIPPGSQRSSWTAGEKSVFMVHFQDWVRRGVDPTRHWGLFSVDFISKTGNQCRIFYQKPDVLQSLLYWRPPNRENAIALREIMVSKFSFVCEIVAQHHHITEVNAAARECASEEIMREHVTRQRCLTHETTLEDKVTYTQYPGTGCDTGSAMCYAAAILQFLMRIDELIDLVSLQLIVSKNTFLKLLIDMRYQVETEGPLIQLDGVLEICGLDVTQQQDAHEFFVLVLSRLRESFDAQYQHKFDELFVTTLQKRIGDTFSNDRIINLDVHVNDRGESLELSDLIESQLISGSIIFLSCGRLLAIHVIRTAVTESQGQVHVRKLLSRVSYPPSLDMTPFGGDVYSLVGVIYHIGPSTECGHYISLMFEGDTILCIDGCRCAFAPSYNELQKCLDGAQEYMFLYGNNLHVRCSFVVSRLACPGASRDSGEEDPPCSPSEDNTPIAPSPQRSSNNVTQRSPQRFRSVRTTWGAHARFLERIAGIIESRKKGKSYHMSWEEKFFIAAFSGRGISNVRLADAIGRHSSTVGRFMEAPFGTEPQKRANFLSNNELLKIVLNESLKAQRLSSSRLAAKIFVEYHTLISKETVRKLRRKAGLRFLSPIPKARLTDLNKNTRVVFACDWLENRLNLLRRTPIVFSDESKFVLCDAGKRLWRIPGECLESDYVDREQHPVQVMVWGAIAMGYKSPLLCFTKTCTQDTYIEILSKNAIIEGLDQLFGPFEYVFQQDNAPPHVARKTQEWFSGKLNLLTNWPPHSPDLSPVEMMWALAKAKIDTTGVETAQGLFERVEAVWNSIPQSVVDNMVSSFEARLRAVSLLRGDSLNGRWGYVHRIHVLIRTTPVERLDEEVMKLEIGGLMHVKDNAISRNEPTSTQHDESDTSLEPDIHFSDGHASPLLEIADLENAAAVDGSTESSDDGQWDVPMAEPDFPRDETDGRSTLFTARERLEVIIDSTVRFFRRLFTGQTEKS